MSIILDGTTGITTPGLTNTGTETLVNLTTTGNTTLGDASTDTLNVGNGGLIKDASGNVGIGVTPSAWTAGRTALQIYGSSTAVYFAGATTNTVFANNYYYNAGDKFVTASGYAQNYQQQSGGSHVWLTSSATSGGAGATATMNTLMTLDASGNFGVGYTSPRAVSNYRTLALGGTSNGGLLDMVNGSGSVLGTWYSDSSGSLSINADPNGSFASSNIIFQVDGSERARIDSSGNLLVGATSNVTNAARLLVQTASDYQLTLNASTSSGSVYSAMNFTQTGTVKGAIYQDHANTRLTIQCNGSGGVYLASGATSWTANSDERLKDIIEPITDATNKVSSLRAVIGKYKTDEEGTRRSFLIAQDVQSVLPEAVTSGTLSRSEDTTEYLGVAYTDVIPLLVAAIKEQQSIINTLTDRISALEQK